MQQFTGYLSLVMLVSYLGGFFYSQLTAQPFVYGSLQLQFTLFSLALGYLVRLVRNETVVAICFAIMLLAVAKFSWVWFGSTLSERVIGSLFGGYLVAFMLCSYQIAILRREIKQKKLDVSPTNESTPKE
jgi:hypothetical protein